MLCDECGERNATFHITTITDGEKTEKALCPVCMAKYKSRMPGIDFGNLAGMLAGIMNSAIKQQKEDEPVDEETAGIVCPRCGMTYGEFKKTGALGCAACYEAFREPLSKMINRIHGNVQHTGKVPGGSVHSVSVRMTIENLKQQLVKAIADEAYEDAAVYRDQIKALSQQLEQSEGKERPEDDRTV